MRIRTMLLAGAGAVAADVFTTYVALTAPSGAFHESTPAVAGLIAAHGLVAGLAAAALLRLAAFGVVAAVAHRCMWVAPFLVTIGLCGAAYTWAIAAGNVWALGHP